MIRSQVNYDLKYGHVSTYRRQRVQSDAEHSGQGEETNFRGVYYFFFGRADEIVMDACSKEVTVRIMYLGAFAAISG